MNFATWQLWLIAALMLLLADIFVAGGASGVLMVLALAGVGGMLAALFGFGLAGQLIAAATVGLVATPLVVWLLRRVTGGSSDGPMVDSRVANRTFEVVDHRGRRGIEVFGDFFPVRYREGGDPPLGQQVRVLQFEGIVALVRPAEPDEMLSPSASSPRSRPGPFPTDQP